MVVNQVDTETLNLEREVEAPLEIELEVRDYELDYQGIVNNAVYLNYLEHARHKYLSAKGLNFAELHAQGTDLVVIRNEIDYKFPLRANNRFVVTSTTERAGYLKLIFKHAILKLPERKLCVQARVTGVALQNGRPIRVDQIKGL